MQDDIQSLSDYLTVKDQAGHIMVQVALLATVYFENAHMPEVREAMLRCCEDYLRLCGQNIRWVLGPGPHDLASFGRSRFASPRSWIPQVSEKKGLDILYHGAPYKKGASAFLFCGIAQPWRRPGELGHVQLAFPVTLFLDREEHFHDFILEVCRKLSPVSGYGGIGLVESPYPEVGMYFQPFAFQMTQRFPGLEVDYPTSHSCWLEDGIKGGNWLTVLGDRWLAKLGGEDALRAQLAMLDGRFVIHTYDHGVMIQAGPHPQLGDAEHDNWPELYVKLAKVLKPIRVTEHGPFHFAAPLREAPGTPRFDSSLSEAWLRRFDDR